MYSDPAEVIRKGISSGIRHDFVPFIEKVFLSLHPGTPFLPNWHIELLAEYLEACRKKELRRLIINMPPRNLKSIVVSVAWPAFVLGHNPACKIMAASYAAPLSEKHSLDCRNIVQSDWYREIFPDVMLARDQNEKHKFATTEFGHRIAVSVGGSATGEGGELLIVDDPQSAMMAMSEANRQFTRDWFDHTFLTRLNDKHQGVIVLVMQRLHEEDLSGHLLGKGGWEHLLLPAMAEREMSYHFGHFTKMRKAGEPLHPEREDEALILEAKRGLGSYMFAAQYQQNPLPLEGGMIRREWLNRYNSRPENITAIVQSWDTAIKAGDRHDASVCLTFGQNGQASYLLDVQVVRAEYPELKRLVLKLADEWEPEWILMEDKASGQSLLQDLRRDSRLPLIPVMPRADKVTRLAAASALIEAGRFYLPKEASWLVEFERELLAFPKAPHDDQVDALAQYLNWLKQKNGAKANIRPL